MEQHKTNESVKSGLEIETNKPGKLPIAGAETETSNEDALKEIDADDMVHQQSKEIKPTGEEQDADDMVHSIPASKTVSENSEIDPDDLVHQK